jgi:hypothetical protein
MKDSVALLVTVLRTLLMPKILASGQLHGPATSEDRVTDLTDLYAFPTPQAPGFLTIYLGTGAPRGAVHVVRLLAPTLAP